MYGSIHTHLESDKDAVNASYGPDGKIGFYNALNEFHKLGAKRIAVTEHGSFSSFDDVFDSLGKFKKANPDAADMEVIPGCEIYFDLKGNNDPADRAHTILVAKDRTGYEQLCKILTRAASTVQSSQVKDYQIVTLENLKESIGDDKGHLICTSACIAGPFAKALVADDIFIAEKVDEKRKFLEEADYFSHKEIVDAYENKVAEIKAKNPTKEEKAEAKANKDVALQKSLVERAALVKTELASDEVKTLKDAADEASQFIKSNKLTRHANIYYKLLEDQANINEFTRENGEKLAKELFTEFKDMFGDDFYFEIQNHGLESEKITYNRLIQFAIDNNHPHFIASNDIHIAMHKSNPDFAKEVTKRKVAKFLMFKRPDADREDDREYGIKDDNELREELLKIVEDYKGFSKEQIIDGAISNIENSLSECQGYKRLKNKSYPVFAPNDKELLLDLIKKGLREKFPEGFPKGKEQIYLDRIKYEYKIICDMGYASYHLIVRDYIKYGRLLGYLNEDEIKDAPLDIDELDKYITEKGYDRIGYSMGPGRGSGAGSLICYAIGITDVDPIKYDLLFERFLNPERKSMPDIDVDFAPNIRDKCVRYTEKKYGEDKVCKIITKSYSKSKGAIRLAARYLGSLEATKKGLDPTKDNGGKPIVREWSTLADAICKYIDKQRGDDSSLFEGMDEIYIDPEDAEEEGATNDNDLDVLTSDAVIEIAGEDKASQQNITKILNLSHVLNGIHTGTGQHAAGVIISSVPLDQVTPIMYNTKKGTMQTQCVMAQCEDMGLLKMDFLGLRNLSIITNVMKRTGDTTLQDYTKRDAVLNDPRIYKNIFRSLKTAGVFQFESAGMQKTLDSIKPTCFEDIIAAISLFRPGPMDFIPVFAENKAHPEKIKYICPEMEEITGNTYGVIVYQEQVMHIFQKLAGYTLGGADAVRKAISKKHIEDIEAERKPFIHGDPERNIEGIMAKCGVSEKDADELFNTMVKFGSYAFNKSHATAYAMVALFTAYLKEYHPIEFYIETLKSFDTNKRGKIIGRYMKEMAEDGITLLPPSILHSEDEFSPYGNKAIIMGFSDIKDMQSFELKYRTDNLYEFVLRNPQVTKPTLIGLANVGMFKTIWNPEGRKCSIKEALDFIEEAKPLIDEVNSRRNEAVMLKQSFKDTTLDDKQRSDIARQYEVNKEAFDQARKNIMSIKAHWNYPCVSAEDRVTLFHNEKEAFNCVLSVQKEIGLLKNCKTDFKDERLFIGTEPVFIDAIVTDVSEPKKTKSGNPYVNVTLMDKNKNTLVRRFSNPPEFMIGTFKLQPNETRFFISSAVKPLSNLNDSKTETIGFSDAMKRIASGEITKENIVSTNDMNSGSKNMVTLSIKKENTPLFNSTEVNSEDIEKESDDLCMDEHN